MTIFLGLITYGEWPVPICLSTANAASIARATFPYISGNTWLYISIVVATLAWPRRSDTTFGLTPCSRSIVAWVCRRPWIVSFSTPDVVTTFLNALVIRLGPIAVPVSKSFQITAKQTDQVIWNYGTSSLRPLS